jgi:S1-C subfamily serine protease
MIETKFNCPACGRVLSNRNPHAVGMEVNCPKCRKRLRVPAAPEPATAPKADEQQPDPAALLAQMSRWLGEMTAEQSATPAPAPVSEPVEQPAAGPSPVPAPPLPEGGLEVLTGLNTSYAAAPTQKSSKQNGNRHRKAIVVWSIAGGVTLVLLVAGIAVALMDSPPEKGQKRQPNTGRRQEARVPSPLSQDPVRDSDPAAGIVVTRDGFILTTSRLMDGAGVLRIRLNGVKDPVIAKRVAQEGSLALLQIPAPVGVSLKPLSIVTERPVKRGEEVSAWGFLEGDITLTAPKLVRGVISALPAATNGDLLELDAHVNPGNAGSPLCDAFGNVVGMVSPRNLDEPMAVHGTGFAVPASRLAAFLKKHVAGYMPATANTIKKEWFEIDSLVVSSLVIITKTAK